MNAQDRANDEYADNFQRTDTTAKTLGGAAMNSMPIPLPLEIPPPPNLSQLPAHILHSGTVETLIGQNEDLMTRLKVNIRRNSILEQQLMEQDRQHAALKNEHAILTAQYQVLQEKSEMLRDKSQMSDLRTEDLEEQLQLLNAKVESAEERSAELRAGLTFETAYRRRIRAWVRPFVDNLKAQLDEARTRIGFLDRQLGTREAVIGDLRERLEKTISQMQSLQVTHNQTQAKLIEGYEARIAEADRLRDKAKIVDEAVSARAQAENKIISLERQVKEIEEQVHAYRKEAKTLAAEALTATQDCERAKADSEQARAELMRSQDQFESLQAVWAEAQKKLEASLLQQDALNKLNQELSRQLKQERKARESLAGAVAAPLNDKSLEKSPSETTTERIGKIDSILAEIEAGFSKSKMDFIEGQASNEASSQSSSELSSETSSL